MGNHVKLQLELREHIKKIGVTWEGQGDWSSQTEEVNLRLGFHLSSSDRGCRSWIKHGRRRCACSDDGIGNAGNVALACFRRFICDGTHRNSPPSMSEIPPSARCMCARVVAAPARSRESGAVKLAAAPGKAKSAFTVYLAPRGLSRRNTLIHSNCLSCGGSCNSRTFLRAVFGVGCVTIPVEASSNWH